MACLAGKRPEAYSRMTLRDWVSKVNKVPFNKAQKLLQASLDSDNSTSTLELADKEFQSLRERGEDPDEDGWWSAISLKFHKTCSSFDLWILLSPVEITLLYCFESVRHEFLTQILGWKPEEADNLDRPFFIGTNGSLLIGRKGINLNPFVTATSCGPLTGKSFRTMMSDRSINHRNLAVQDGER